MGAAGKHKTRPDLTHPFIPLTHSSFIRPGFLRHEMTVLILMFHSCTSLTNNNATPKYSWRLPPTTQPKCLHAHTAVPVHGHTAMCHSILCCVCVTFPYLISSMRPSQLSTWLLEAPFFSPTGCGISLTFTWPEQIINALGTLAFSQNPFPSADTPRTRRHSAHTLGDLTDKS